MIDIINDRYEIRDFQKLTASGKIFDAYDLKLNRQVIVKIIEIKNDNVIKRFKRFIKNSGQLIHPSIITVLDYGVEPTFCYSVHEHIHTQSCEFTLDKIAVLNTKDKLNIMMNILVAVNFAHSINIQHHNLYFDSIYLFEDMSIKIDNFDLRRFLLKETLYSELGIETQTPPIIPPELFYGKKSSHALSDIFQLGAIAYAMFCEIFPFGEALNESNIHHNRKSNFYDPKKFSTIPEYWQELITQSLQTTIADRPQSISAILKDLETIQQENVEDNETIEHLPKSRSYQLIIQDDQTHIIVNPNSTDIDLVEIETKLLSENIYNYDIHKIEEAIKLPPGKLYPVGEILKKCDPDQFEGMEIEITADAMEAYVRIPKDIEITTTELLFYLKKNGIRHGLIHRNINRAANISSYQAQLIAVGTPPVTGQDAYLINFFELENVQKPKESENGSVDFKETHFVQEVMQDDILCIKVPATEGTPGTDVYQTSIDSISGKDMKLPSGKNTYISGDGLKLKSTMEGQFNVIRNNIEIKETIIIQGDVDYAVGNINYHGDVTIRGDVLPEFSVTAVGNIIISGVVEGANITSQKGSIKISSGIFGKERCTISALQSIKADFVQDAKITSECDVNITNYVMNSHINAGRYFRCHKGIGSVYGSTIEASRTIDLNIAGAIPSVKTFFTIKPHNRSAIKHDINRLMENLENIYSSQELAKKHLKKVILKYGSIEDALMDNEYKLLTEKLKRLGILKLLTEEKLKLSRDNFEYCTDSANYSISIRRMLHNDVIFKIGNNVYRTDKDYEGKLIVTSKNNKLTLQAR